MISVDHPAFLGAVAAAQTAADRVHAAGFTGVRIAVIAGLATGHAEALLDDALARGWVAPVATIPVRWQLTGPGRQAVAGVELAAAHKPVRRRSRTPIGASRAPR